LSRAGLAAQFKIEDSSHTQQLIYVKASLVIQWPPVYRRFIAREFAREPLFEDVVLRRKKLHCVSVTRAEAQSRRLPAQSG
jgi:hypothetical protein